MRPFARLSQLSRPSRLTTQTRQGRLGHSAAATAAATAAAATLALLLGLATSGTAAAGSAAEAAVPAAPTAAAPAQPPAPAPASIALPWLTLVYRADQGVELRGVVPNDMERAAMLHRAHSLYGSHHVVAHLSAGAVANPSWLNPAFLPDLRVLHHGQMQLRDGRLEVDGEARNQASRANLASTLAGMAAQGLLVEMRVALRER